jgi:hypothetical protein
MAVILGACSGLAGGLCKNDVLGKYPAPTRQFEAILFVRNCGATTSFSTNVSLLVSGDRLGDEAGNVFLVRAASYTRVPTNRIGGPQVEVQWLPGDTLMVQYPVGIEIRRQVLIEHGIPIRYALLP